MSSARSSGADVRPQSDLNGLSDYVSAVEAARERLGRDLDRLTMEVRAEMGQAVEKTVWKIAATGFAVVAGIAARKGLVAAWRKTKHGDPPANPAAPGTQWSDAIIWTIASGLAVGVARLVAERGAAAGWRRSLGHLPPGLEDVTP